MRTYVRLPESERNSKQALESLLLRTQAGGEIPFSAAATVSEGRAETEIKRSEGRRVVNITADIQEGANANKILASVKDKIMPALVDDHPGLKFSLEGEQREQADALGSLRTGAMMSLLGIFALLAIPFRSYVQPLIIMSAIPFGLVGAILGHVVMQVELSLMSIMGIVALTGIVVNDSLVLIVFINKLRAEGASVSEAVRRGSAERFRPIILTSLTTFLGLAPMLAETSVQARFLVPMAISLAFGVLFATVIILLLVPCFYTGLEDLRSLTSRKRKVTDETLEFDLSDDTTLEPGHI